MMPTKRDLELHVAGLEESLEEAKEALAEAQQAIDRALGLDPEQEEPEEPELED